MAWGILVCLCGVRCVLRACVACVARVACVACVPSTAPIPAANP